jgi:hypothetical protein
MFVASLGIGEPNPEQFLLGSFFIRLMHNPVDKAHNQILYIVAMFANQACST